MKHFFIITAISSMLVFAMASCTNYTVEEGKTNLEKESLQSLLLEKGTTPITANEAINVALLYNKQNKIETKGELEKNVSDVYTVYRKEGEPSMYAVNYQNNKGFIVVSASRKYYPILAMVEKGHFDEGYAEMGLSDWVDEQTNLISKIEKGEMNGDETAIAAEWANYEKRGGVQGIATKSEAEAFALRQASVAAWESQGYTCYELQECPQNLPTSVYNTWCSTASGVAHPDYDYMIYSVILEKRVENTTTYGPLIGSEWDQTGGFNAANPYTYAIGCVPVAVGQIMWYYGKPSSFSWNNMPASYATTTTANFLYTLGNTMGIDYAGGSSAASHGDAEDALQYYGYGTSFSNSYNQETIISNIIDGDPVYIGGYETYYSGGVGHAWVCEGYKRVDHHYEYDLKIISVVEPPLQYENAVPTCLTAYGTTKYLYHNLGFGGDGNGWYIGQSFQTPADGTFQSACMIYNITPPSN
jgi:hypothetical protein